MNVRDFKNVSKCKEIPINSLKTYNNQKHTRTNIDRTHHIEKKKKHLSYVVLVAILAS